MVWISHAPHGRATRQHGALPPRADESTLMAANLRGRRVAVTGGAGFIGVHSVEALLDAGAAVLVIDDLRHASYRPLPAAARLENADIADGSARAAIESWKPHAILHLAAQGGVNRSWREPAADAHINVLGTVSILAAAM